jgi:hypothetical protein
MPDAKPNDNLTFLRLVRDGNGVVVSLETPIVHFTRDDGEESVTVDLIGAVHIGDQAYYDTLNQAFDTYDVVLYEGVFPRHVHTFTPGDKSALSMLNRALAHQLGLSVQMDCVNYQRDNFLHADMTLEDFIATLNERKESLFSAIAPPEEQTTPTAPMDAEKFQSEMSGALTAMHEFLMQSDSGVELKRSLLTTLSDTVGSLDAIFGARESTMISERNKVALKVLKAQMKMGHRRLALFYGAAHHPDLERRLVEQFGMHRAGERWLIAWDLRG